MKRDEATAMGTDAAQADIDDGIVSERGEIIDPETLCMVLERKIVQYIGLQAWTVEELRRMADDFGIKDPSRADSQFVQRRLIKRHPELSPDLLATVPDGEPPRLPIALAEEAYSERIGLLSKS